MLSPLLAKNVSADSNNDSYPNHSPLSVSTGNAVKRGVPLFSQVPSSVARRVVALIVHRSDY